MISLYRLQYRTSSSLVHTSILKPSIHWNLLSKMFGLCRSAWTVGSVVVFCLVCTVISHNNVQVWFISLEEYPFLVNWWTNSSLDWLRGFCQCWFSRSKHVDLWLSYLIMHSNRSKCSSSQQISKHVHSRISPSAENGILEITWIKQHTRWVLKWIHTCNRCRT